MINLSDFANFGELYFGGGRQTKLCAPGAINPCYASGNIPAVADILASSTEGGRGNGFHEWGGYKIHEISGEEKWAPQEDYELA